MCTPNPCPSDLAEGELPGDDSTTPILTEEEIEEAMEDVIDPELTVNIADLSLLYGATVGGEANVISDMTFVSPVCPLTNRTEYDMKYVLCGPANLVTINWVWLPLWTLEMITEDGREQLRAIGYNL